MHTPVEFDSDLNPKNKSTVQRHEISLMGGCGFESPHCNEQGDCRIKFARANKEAYYTTTRLAVYRAH